MPTKEISLLEIRAILISKGIFDKDDPKLDTAVKFIFEYLETLISPITLPTSNVGGKVTSLKERNPKEERIVNIYRLTLGREPSVNDLSYLSSLNIQEDQLLRKMVESLEHAEVVKARQEVLTARVGFNGMRRQLEEVESNLKDKEAILANLQEILEQKNASYEDLNVKYEALSRKFNEVLKVEVSENTTSTIDRILDWFNKRFG